jgi:hypothetical protein
VLTQNKKSDGSQQMMRRMELSQRDMHKEIYNFASIPSTSIEISSMLLIDLFQYGNLVLCLLL